jgi:type I restriction enzyme S subunit
MSLATHAELKPSGSRWLGDIPVHWDVVPLKHLCLLLKDGTHLPPARVDDGIPLLSVRNLVDGEFVLRDDDSMISVESYEALCRPFVPEPNDVLLAIVGATIGKTALVSGGLGRFHIQRSLGIFRTRVEMYGPLFLNFVFQSGEFQSKLWELVGYSAQPGIYLGTLQNLRMPVPPETEQKMISSFLDVETSKIDGLVSEQRRLIELLKEKRQAVISHTVTKGLNPNAPMKPSGIQWLGDVPKHWDVGPLKRFWSVTDCKHVTADFIDDGTPLASIKEVQSRWISLDDAKRTTQEFYELLIEGDREPQVGDLIFSRNATVGEVAQVGEHTPKFAMGQDVCLLRKHDAESSSDYLQYVIKSAAVVEQLNVLMVGATFMRINVDEIRNLAVVSPPSEEQSAIAEFLEQRVGQFDSLVAEAERAIELLQERRTALISAAVTGKIDVREFAFQEAA